MILQLGMKVKHYKGAIYTIILIGYCSETNRKLVVYNSIDSVVIWIRPYDMFNDIVQNEYGEFVPRFAQVI